MNTLVTDSRWDQNTRIFAMDSQVIRVIWLVMDTLDLVQIRYIHVVNKKIVMNPLLPQYASDNMSGDAESPKSSSYRCDILDPW